MEMVGYTWSATCPVSSFSHLLTSEVSHQHPTSRNTYKCCWVLAKILDSYLEDWGFILNSLITLGNSLAESSGNIWLMQANQASVLQVFFCGTENFSEWADCIGRWLGKIPGALTTSTSFCVIFNTQEGSMEWCRAHIFRPWVEAAHSFMFQWQWRRKAGNERILLTLLLLLRQVLFSFFLFFCFSQKQNLLQSSSNI